MDVWFTLQKALILLYYRGMSDQRNRTYSIANDTSGNPTNNKPSLHPRPFALLIQLFKYQPLSCASTAAY